MKSDLFFPVPTIMPLEESEERIVELKRYAKAIDDLIGMGTHLLQWEVTSTAASGDEVSYVSAFFKRAIEIIDGASILVENASVIPIKGHIRILMEIELQLEYLLSDPLTLEKKVLHLAIMEHYYLLLEAEKMLKEPRAKSYWSEYRKDAAMYASLIDSSRFDTVRVDFEDNIYTKPPNRRRKKQPPYWYTLSGGGRTISELFETLDRKHYHREVYSILSETVHSSKLILDTIYVGEDGAFRIKKIRDSSHAKDIIMSLIRITLEI